MSKTHKNRKYYQFNANLPSWKWQRAYPTNLVYTPLTIYGLRKDGNIVVLGTQNICAYNRRDGMLLTPKLKKAVEGWEAFRLIAFAGVTGEGVEQVLQESYGLPLIF